MNLIKVKNKKRTLGYYICEKLGEIQITTAKQSAPKFNTKKSVTTIKWLSWNYPEFKFKIEKLF